MGAIKSLTMKRLLTLFLILFSSCAFCASRYWVGGGLTSNWDATGNTNWSATSGGANNASVPTSTDDVFFDGVGASANSASTISATITVKSLTISAGYTSTITHNAVLTIAGSWTMHSGFTIGGSSAIIISATSTITSGGKTWPNNLTLSATSAQFTTTLSGNFVMLGSLTSSSPRSTETNTLNKTTSETFSCAGLDLNGGNHSVSGTATIILTGGTWQTTNGASWGNPLTFAGNVTISGSVQYSGSLITYSSGTITTTGSTMTFVYGPMTVNTNGITWNNLTIGSTIGSATFTLTSNITVTGLLTIAPSSNVIIITINKTTSEQINASGGLTVNTNLAGTALFNLSGGTMSAGANGICNSSVTFSGNVTVTGTWTTQGGTLTYSSGTITTTSSTLFLRYGPVTLNTNGMTWNNITVGSGVGFFTTTLTSNLSCSGLLTITGAAMTINRTTAETITSSGGLTVNNSLAGTAKVILTGGTWSGSNTTGIGNNLDLQGNVTVSSGVYYGTGTLNYVSGTITTTSSTLNLSSSCTLTTSGVTWNNITTTNGTGQTYTINSALVGSGTLTIGTGAATTFAGSAGFTCATLLNQSTSATTISFKEAITYTITSGLSCYLSRNGSTVLFTSSHATTKAIFALQNGATCNLLADLTRIDASPGRTLNSYNGIITSCINVREFHDLQSVGSSGD
jgi:hypothetical protein